MARSSLVIDRFEVVCFSLQNNILMACCLICNGEIGTQGQGMFSNSTQLIREEEFECGSE